MFPLVLTISAIPFAGALACMVLAHAVAPGSRRAPDEVQAPAG